MSVTEWLLRLSCIESQSKRSPGVSPSDKSVSHGPQINDIDFPRLLVYFRDYYGYLAMAFPLSLDVSMSQPRELH